MPSVSDGKNSDVPDDLREINRRAITRLANTFYSKAKKFHTSYSQLPHVANKPFVLAIAPFDRPHYQLQVQRAIEALLFDYYVDEQDVQDGDGIGFTVKSLGSVKKESGADIRLGVFNDSQFNGISAVHFSTVGSWGKVRALADDRDALTSFTTLREGPNAEELTTALLNNL